LVGHGNLRSLVLQFERRKPTENELKDMKQMLTRAMEEGAFGMSTGLIYPPSCYADTKEIVELCKVVARFGGFYSSHIRGEESQLLKSVKEAIEIGENAALPVEISHHKAAGRRNWGKVRDLLKMIEEARSQEVEVTFDVYPYVAGSFGLDALLPPHAHEGGVEKLVQRLRSREIRERLKEEMTKGVGEWHGVAEVLGWENIMIAYCKGHPEYEGRKISEITRKKSGPVRLCV